MNELVKLGIDLLRRIVPTWAALQRTWIGAMREPRFTAAVVFVCLVLPALVGTGVLLYGQVRGERELEIGGRFLVLLPDRYPEAAFTLQQRTPGIAAWASDALQQRLQVLRKRYPGITPQPRVQADADGRFTLLLNDAGAPLHDPARPALAAEIRAQYEAALRAAGEAVAVQLPAGSRVAVLDVVNAQRLLRSTRHLLLPYVGVPYGLVLLVLYLLMRHNQVVDKALAQAVFPSATRFLQVKRYGDWSDRLRRGQPPQELHVLAEFVAAQYRAGRRSVAIVSGLPGEGKSTLTLMLWQVLRHRLPLRLVDADRRADLLRVLGKRQPGDDGPTDLHVCFARSAAGAPAAAPGLPVPPADAEVLNLIDCTPLLWAREELSVVQHAETVVLVVEEVRQRGGFARLAEQLEFLGVAPAVVVVNKSTRGWADGGYGYGYAF